VETGFRFGEFFENPDGRGLMQVFHNRKYGNWGINPEALLRCWAFPRGLSRIQLVPADHSYGTPANPDWLIAIPVPTLMRKLARSGDYFDTPRGGFYRLFDITITPQDKE
jgi:hypothetical protein